MSVMILGGNECMERRYKELCQSYKCSAKVFTKPAGGLKNKHLCCSWLDRETGILLLTLETL